MGIYVYEPGVLKYVEPGQYLDFPDLVLRLACPRGTGVRLSERLPVAGHRPGPTDYARAQQMFSDKANMFDYA